MTRQRLLLVAVFVLLVGLAGCGMADTGGTPTASTDAGADDGTAPENASEQAIDAISAVEDYRVEATETRTLIGDQTQTVQIEQAIEVNRPDRRLHRAANQTVAGRTVAVDTYLLNETVYQRSPAYVRQFSAEWVRVDASGNVSRAWRAAEPLGRQARIIDTATVSANGTETIDGREAYRIETEADPERLEELFVGLVAGPTSEFNGSTYSVTGASYTFWIAADTHRPLRVSGNLESRVSARGRNVTIRQSFTFEYDYDAPISVDLPDAASNAVPLSEALNGTTPGT